MVDRTSAGTGGGASRGFLEWMTSLRPPVVFLVLTVAVAGVMAFEAYRTQRSHAETANDLLEDYGEFAAWSYQQRAWQLLGNALETSLRVARTNQQFALGHATQQCLMLILDDGENDSCSCGPLVTGRYSFFTRLGDDVEQSMWAGEPPDEETQAAIIEAIQAHARTEYQQEWTHALTVLSDVPGLPIIAYTRIRSPSPINQRLEVQRDSLVYAFEVDPYRLAQLFARVLEDDAILPPSLTRDRPEQGNDDLMVVEVAAPDGTLLYSSRPGAELAFSAETVRRPEYGGGVVRASVLPEVADALIIGGLPKDRTPLLVFILSLAAALAVLAVLQLRREDQLALLRQDFVASVSHELRTPLAQVRLFTETLRLGRTTNEEQESWALENIDRETLRLTNLVENILHFSRAERGVARIERDPADLAEVVAETLSSFAPLIPRDKAVVEHDLPEGLLADLHRDSIRQVVLNLLDNAVRYGPAGQTIRVGGASTPERVRIWIEDEGPGVPVSERARIFQPFQRGAGSVGTVVVGSGIGLSVVAGIIEAHDGEVWAEAAAGGGARFVFELPALHTATAAHFTDAHVGKDSSKSEVA